MKLRWRHSCTIIDVIREPVPSPQIFLLIGLLCGATAIYTGMPNEGRADFGKISWSGFNPNALVLDWLTPDAIKSKLQC